jgi:2-methylcitrate dehydratase PrpD
MKKPPSAEPGITASLARELAARRDRELPGAVISHAKTHFLNALALAISAAGQAPVQDAVKLGRLVGGPGTCPVPGRIERLDLPSAALAIGIAAHVDDFDDTHLATVIHPSAATLAAVLPLALSVEASGAAALAAFTWGCEVQLRVGLAMSPSHYDAGWHITGTAGVIGAAAAAGLLLGLDEPALASALAIAASSTVGQREGFGTMTKALHAGKAAGNGLFAALLARDGFTGPHDALEAPRGYFHVLAAESDDRIVMRGLGETWHLFDNAVKPYPCGIVAHPVIDAGRALRARGTDVHRVRRLLVHCNPLVPDLMGNLDPADGLQARFSAIHGLAVGLLDDTVALASYTDERVRRKDVIDIRSRTELVPAPSCARDAVSVTAELDDGSSVTVDIDHARGSLDRPLTSDEVRAKVDALLEPVLPDRGADVVAAVAEMTTSPDLRRLAAAMVPERSAA